MEITWLNLALLRDMSRNLIQEIPQKAGLGMPHLSIALFSSTNHRGLAFTTFQNMANLTILSLQNSHIYTICDQAFKELGTLTDLNLSKNKIKDISNMTFYGLYSLKIMNLKDNMIEQVPESALEGLISLQHLNLDNNRFKSINENICFGSRRLKILSINENYIKHANFGALRECLSSLNTLLLQKNMISFLNVTSLSNMYALRTLNMEGNQIFTIHLDAFTSVKPLPRLYFVNLRNNPISDISPDAFTVFSNAQVLLISQEKSNERALSALKKLQRLYINPSHVDSDYTFSQNPLLSWIIITNAQNTSFTIKRTRFEGLINLKRLFLEMNKLSVIREKTFVGLNRLLELQWSGTSLGPDNFKYAESPIIVGLLCSHCGIREIKPEHFQKLQTIQALSLLVEITRVGKGLLIKQLILT
ncbi:Insulin-like growth factor-binding protein complex acid labile subunit, partial [Trichoplax sp. H2]